MQNTNQNEFRIERVIKTKGDKLYVKWKDYDILIISQYFAEPKSLGERLKLELGLSNYATKANLKIAARVDTLSFT